MNGPRPSSTTTPGAGPAHLHGLFSGERSLITLTAAAGWGKTTVVDHATRSRQRRWVTLDDGHRDPAALDDVLAPLSASSDVEVVVLDDAHVLAGSESMTVLEQLANADSSRPQLVVLSRTDLGLVDAERRAAGSVLELDAQSLAMSLDDVARFVEQQLTRDRALAARILDATGGWPALVRLLIEAVRHLDADARSAAVDAACAPTGPAGNYLDTVVLARESDEARRVLARIALLGRAYRPLLSRADPQLVDDLLARGLLRTDPTASDHLRLVPAVQHLVDEQLRADDGSSSELVDELAASLLAQPDLPRALVLLARRGRSAQVADLLEQHGPLLLRQGHLRVIDEAAEALDPMHLTPDLQRLHAEALAFSGDWVRALDQLAASGLPTDGPLAPELALQAGLIHHVRGDLDAALETYRRGIPRDETSGSEASVAAPAAADAPELDRAREAGATAALHAWLATACWLRGAADEARAAAAIAMDHATRRRDDGALALAHTAAALIAASDGDRHANEAHYRQALHAAERAGDRLQQARIRTNWGSHHLEEGDYLEARQQTEMAIDLAERTGFAMIAGIAHCNRAEILVATGELDHAIADAELGREILATIGARTEAYAHHLLGSARTERGELALAQQAYERALRIATPAGDRQALVPAYLGLAAVLAGSDLDAAEQAAATALELDGGMLRPAAHLAVAWVAAARGDRDTCREHAVLAREEATSRDSAVGVAEAATCLALLDDDPVPALRDARLLWEQLDTPLWTTRIDLAIARRSSDPDERGRVEWLERRLASWGCPPDRGSVAHRMLLTVDTAPRTMIRALGGFVAEREGRPLTPSEWGSRKAQDLARILVVRSGRGISREELADLLWPDQAYDEVSNRLSVALSLARSALAGDGDAAPIVAHGSTLRLDTEVVDVDLDAFTRLAEEGLRAARSTDPATAVPLLLRAEELYGGDLLEDDLDVEWVIDRRLSLRHTYLEVARTIARLASDDDPDLTIRMLLRVLDRDGYDEPAHLNLCLALLRNGRHGEARRRFRVYETRMQELDLPVVPFHELTRETEAGAELAS